MLISDLKLLIESNKISLAIDELIKMTRNLSNGLYQQSALLKIRLNKIENEDSDETEQDIIKAIFVLIERIEELTDESGALQMMLTDTLVVEDSYPFIDRLQFRNILKGVLEKEGSTMIFVQGAPRSGMSHLEKYLLQLSQNNKIFEVIPIDIPATLDDPFPFKGVRLAQYMSILLSLNESLEKEESDQFKFMRFMKSLQANLSERLTIPIVFMHDFHKMNLVPPDMQKLILSIALVLRNHYPRSVFIIAGLNCEDLPNWHTDLKQVCPVYVIEGIDKQAVMDCLSSIFSKYKERIFKLGDAEISEKDYVEGMLARLIPVENQIDLSTVGSLLSEHLIQLKKV